ncbi:Auxin-induced protein [Cinnamomum micranthum f. kanehirae]|uniref:Auxin-induced protein n=1 Tax=Cinnamomum micranthum f. kanehirae TaxID=337451 RepID=A0A443PIN4_9MAGN|nr:Auxin-induced protein [Cinnamomum micranthum f. kanehirae]
MYGKYVADKGHFFMYTVHGRRFMVPLQYLRSPILVELLSMSEGPITLPCEGLHVKYDLIGSEEKCAQGS